MKQLSYSAMPMTETCILFSTAKVLLKKILNTIEYYTWLPKLYNYYNLLECLLQGNFFEYISNQHIDTIHTKDH